MDLAEERPFGGQTTPALAHQVVDIAGAVSRTTQGHGRRRRRRPLRVQVKVLHDAVVVQLFQRALTCQHQDLPQRHAEGPHVTLRCVFALYKVQIRLIPIRINAHFRLVFENYIPSHSVCLQLGIYCIVLL